MLGEALGVLLGVVPCKEDGFEEPACTPQALGAGGMVGDALGVVPGVVPGKEDGLEDAAGTSRAIRERTMTEESVVAGQMVGA